MRLTKRGNLTLREIGRLYAEGILLPHVVGTPIQIADQLEAIFHNGEADGFIISPAYLPGAFEEFVQSVVPELQRRGLFRKEYTGRTLRENLGLGKAGLLPPIDRSSLAQQETDSSIVDGAASELLS